MSVMQGTEGPDRELLDALGLCGHLVGEGSVYRFLAENRRRLFPDELFGDLFKSGWGRPSVPGSQVATVMVLQALEGCSDRSLAGWRGFGDWGWPLTWGFVLWVVVPGWICGGGTCLSV